MKVAHLVVTEALGCIGRDIGWHARAWFHDREGNVGGRTLGCLLENFCFVFQAPWPGESAASVCRDHCLRRAVEEPSALWAQLQEDLAAGALLTASVAPSRDGVAEAVRVGCLLGRSPLRAFRRSGARARPLRRRVLPARGLASAQGGAPRCLAESSGRDRRVAPPLFVA